MHRNKRLSIGVMLPTTFCLSPMQKQKIAYQAQLDIFATEVLPKLRS